jgi:predicted N-formylglutamate amidohydrolase
MLEIRNDLIADAPGQRRMADLLARTLGEALSGLEGERTPAKARNFR